LTDARCSKQPACKQQGLCSASGATCVASIPDHCQRSLMCKRSGACSLRRGRCGVASDADCQRSELCDARGLCFHQRGGCSSSCGREPSSGEERNRALLGFYGKWREIDDGEVATYWKCVVRARNRDVRLARDPQEVLDGLSKAFHHFPRTQAGRLRDNCAPLLEVTRRKLLRLCPPTRGFGKALAGFRASLALNRKVVLKYANQLRLRREQVINEKEILKLAGAFHKAYEDKKVAASDKPLSYWNVLRCAVPDLVVKVRKIKKPPDTQPVVEHFYHQCVKKGVASRPAANKLRGCYDSNNGGTDQKDKQYLLALRNLSGDDRDMMAIDACFKKDGQAVVGQTLEAVGKAFQRYRQARKAIQDRMTEEVRGR